MTQLNLLHRIQCPSAKVLAVAFNREGSLCAAGDRDGVIHIIDVAEGTIVRKLKQHIGFIYAMAIDVDSGALISTGKDRSLRHWDIETGQFLKDDAGIFISGGARTLDAQYLKASTKSHTMTVLCLATAAGGVMATGGQDKNVKFWRNGEPLRSFNWHEGPVTVVRFQPETGVLFSASRDKTIRSWNEANGAMLEKYLGHDDEVVGLVFGSKERFYSVDLKGRVLAWQSERSSPLGVIYQCPAQAQSLVMSEDAKCLLIGLEDGSLVALDLDGGEGAKLREASFIAKSHGLAVRSLAVHRSGLVASADNGGVVQLSRLQ